MNYGESAPFSNSTCSFNGRLNASKSQRNDPFILRILKARLPGVIGIEVAETSDDKNGTDYWATRNSSLPNLSVDVKFRWTDPIEKYGTDDLIVESWSVLYCDPGEWPKGQYEAYYVRERQDEFNYIKPGWCWDESKRTDYAMWFWVPTKRFFIVPFPALCCVVKADLEEWRRWRNLHLQHTWHDHTGAYRWTSEHICVSRPRLMERLNSWAHGTIK